MTEPDRHLPDLELSPSPARTIIHADLDAFYASVEQIDHPEFRGRPVVVGGSPEYRGVVAAASYEARRFGIRSAMPMSRALRLCPDAIRVSPRFDRYAELSRQVMAMFRAITPLVEPLSLDEAFLDVSELIGRPDDAASLAHSIKADVRERTGLTVSVGVGTNKTVAKIASDQGKPDGLVIVPAGAEAEYLAPLPVRSLWGIGPKAEGRLHAVGITTIGELANADAAHLAQLLGAWGIEARGLARGIDGREVQTVRQRKSVGAERTFPRDLSTGPELDAELSKVASEVAARLRDKDLRGRTVVLKLRYANFRTITRQTSLLVATDDAETIAGAAQSLLDRTAVSGDRFRLLGIQIAHLVGLATETLPLWQR